MRQHCETQTHQRILFEVTGFRPAPKGSREDFSMEETSNDGSSSGLAFVDREFKGKIKYQPRSREEIAAALAEATREGSNHGSITGSDTGLFPTDGVSGLCSTDGVSVLSPTDGVSTEGPTPDHVRPKSGEKAWDYFRPTRVQNSSGNTMWECLFCDYEGTRNVTHFKRHLVHACPGVPDEVRSQIKAQGKTGQKWKRRMKDQSARRLRPKWMEEMTEESEESQDGDASHRAVEILTKLFTTKEGTELEGKDLEGKDLEGRKGSLLHLTDTELEREMKELKVKKMRVEVRKVEGEVRRMEEEAGLGKRRVEVEIEEGKERAAFFNSLTSNLHRVCSNLDRICSSLDRITSHLDKLVSSPTDSVRESILTAIRNQSGSILQDAFAETIDR